MARYEMIREIFNSCSGNQMRDVNITEIETDSIEDYVRSFLDDPEATVERNEEPDGTTVFTIMKSGLLQKYGFSPMGNK